MVFYSAVFLQKIGSGTHNAPKFGRRGEMLVISMQGKVGSGLRLLRKNLRNGVPARSVTKIPLMF
jgi:hypothetical protein